MQVTNILGGTFFVAAFAQAALNVATPPASIEIAYLNYVPGADEVVYHPIAHGRSEDDRLPAEWRAVVTRRTAEGTPPPTCEGRGWGRYWERPSPALWTLDATVGDPLGCRDRLGPGPYVLIVEIELPEGGKAVRTARFEIPDGAP